ncbi:MarR family winged helix-turn-helix transcriptional regulator [Brevundimonas sp.]|uniref:MarR family winged helix-turn-helix transcriptional regulator n=1 Tax=Brevundimonas sp. TaxID=1871086 RepID=UPI003D1111AC
MRARTIYLIKRAEVASRSLLETELKDLDLTPSQYATLSMLSSHPDASSSDLARRVLITPQSMSEMIMALDRKSLIKRRESDGNRRVLGISLSAAGRALLEKAEARVDVLETRMFAALGHEDLQALRDHLETVLADDGKGRGRGVAVA